MAMVDITVAAYRWIHSPSQLA